MANFVAAIGSVLDPPVAGRAGGCPGHDVHRPPERHRELLRQDEITGISPPGAVEHADDVLDELRDHLLCDAEQLVANGVERARRRSARCSTSGWLTSWPEASQRARPSAPTAVDHDVVVSGLGAGAVWTAVLAVLPDERGPSGTSPLRVVFFEAAGQWAAP